MNKKITFILIIIIFLQQTVIAYAQDEGREIFTEGAKESYFVTGKTTIQYISYNELSDEADYNRIDINSIAAYTNGNTIAAFYDISEIPEYGLMIMMNQNETRECILISENEAIVMDLTKNRNILNPKPYFEGENISYELLEQTEYEGEIYETVLVKQENEKLSGFKRDSARFIQKNILKNLSASARINTDISVTYLIHSETGEFSYALYSFAFYAKDGSTEYAIELSNQYTYELSETDYEKEGILVEDILLDSEYKITKKDSALIELIRAAIYGR